MPSWSVSWFSPCVWCPWCGQGVQTRVMATIFSPSREALRWLNSTRKELLSWARGKSSSSLWPPSSSSTVWLLLDTKWWLKSRLKNNTTNNNNQFFQSFKFDTWILSKPLYLWWCLGSGQAVLLVLSPTWDALSPGWSTTEPRGTRTSRHQEEEEEAWWRSALLLSISASSLKSVFSTQRCRWVRKRREGRLGSSLVGKMSDRRGWVSVADEEGEADGRRWAG